MVIKITCPYQTKKKDEIMMTVRGGKGERELRGTQHMCYIIVPIRAPAHVRIITSLRTKKAVVD